MNFNILSYIYNVGDLSEYPNRVCSNWNRKFNVLIVWFVVKYVLLRVCVVILSKC